MYVYEASDKSVWVATKKGLISYLPGTIGFNIYKHNEINSFSIASDDINCLYEDKAGSMWIGTNGHGISVYHKSSNRFRHYTQEESMGKNLPNEGIFGFAEDDDENLYLATYKGGLGFFNEQTKIFKAYKKDKNRTLDNILCLHKDKDGLIWIGSWGGGINYYNPVTKQFGPHYENIPDNPNSLCNNTITCFAETPDGILWIGTFRGLATYDKNTGKFGKYTTQDGLSGNSIYSLLVDDGKLWIGTVSEGLNVLDLKSGIVKKYLQAEDNTGLSNNAVNCIHKDKRGML